MTDKKAPPAAPAKAKSRKPAEKPDPLKTFLNDAFSSASAPTRQYLAAGFESAGVKTLNDLIQMDAQKGQDIIRAAFERRAAEMRGHFNDDQFKAEWESIDKPTTHNGITRPFREWLGHGPRENLATASLAILLREASGNHDIFYLKSWAYKDQHGKN